MLSKRFSSLLALASLALVSSVSTVAQAQPAAAAQHTERVAAPPGEEDDDTVFTIQLGGTLNYGNTRSMQFAGATHFMVHRDQHQFTLDLQATLGLAAARNADTRVWGDMEDNARNILGKMRYDFFLDGDNALFAAVGGRHDTFAGLDFRFQGQAGYMRNFFREGEGNVHRLWGEVGFDITVDDRFPNPLRNPAAPPDDMGLPTMCDGAGLPSCFLPNIDDQYSARVFLGYDNRLNESWSFLTGLEALFDVVNPDNIRLVSISEFRVRIAENLQSGLRFSLLFDNVPVPGNDTVDTTTVLTLVYTAL